MHPPAYRIDDRPVDADAFYAAACDATRSVVVEACAGAGKTWMLVSRIVRALLDGVEPQQILAITFTRKAAGEMRERLEDWLAEWSDPSTPDAALVQALRDRGLPPARALAEAPRLRTLQRQLLARGRGVEVRTFHGWFAQLLAFAPLEQREQLGLPPTLRFIEDPAPLRAALLRRFHARVQAAPELLQDYHALVQRHRRGKLLGWLDAAWNKSAEVLAADEAGRLEASVEPAAAAYPECAAVDHPAALLHTPALRALLADVARALAATGKSPSGKAADKLAAALACSDAAQSLESAAGALFTKGQPRKQLVAVEGLGAAMEALQRLNDAVLQHEAHADHQRMVRLTRELLAAYAGLKRERGLVDMTDLERAARMLLADPLLAPWLQERLDLRWRQVLIDEFQDTSPLQWHALASWLAGYAGAGGGASGQQPPALFIVGDPKQSIYRFRRAEPRVFDAAKAFVVDAMDGCVLACDHTRRNAPAVIATVNAVFAEVLAEGGWPAFREHTTASSAAGAVLRLPDVLRDSPAAMAPPRDRWRPSLTEARREPEEQLRHVELRQVAMGIAERLAGGVAPGDVMVLSRRGALLLELAAELAEAGVPHVVPDALLLAESPEALDLIALLDVLASPTQDLALARALKSPLFGADDDELLWLAEQARGGRWWGTLMRAETLPGAALQRAQPLLRRWRDVAARVGPHELLQSIVDGGDVRERFAAAVPAPRLRIALQSIDALLAAAIDHGGSLRGGRFSTLYGFVRALRSGAVEVPTAPPAKAVQLLTVHGAKGLEARFVFLIDADPSRRPSDPATLRVDWPVAQPAPQRVAFVLPGSRLAPSLRGLWDQEQAMDQREELNALYVAMTRAREQLVVSRTEAASRDAAVRSWWSRLEPRAAPWQPAPPVAPAADDAPVWLPARSRLERSAPARTPAANPPQDAAAAAVGRAIHRALEWAGRGGALADPARWPRLAEAAARSFGLADGERRVVAAALQAILDSPRCRAFFDPAQLAWAGDEVPLAWRGEALRADRIVRRADGSWWVIDHKLHPHPHEQPAYREQLQRYVDAVQSLAAGAAVRGAFITAAGELFEL